MRSILSKILLLVFISVMITAITNSIYGIVTIYNLMQTSSLEIMNLLSDKNASILNATFNSVEQSVDILSTHIVTELDSFTKLAGDSNYYSEYTANIQSIATTMAKSTDGALSVYVRYDPYLTNSKSGFFCIKNEDGTFSNVEVSDLSDYNPENPSPSFNWWHKPLTQHTACWIDPYNDPNIPKSIISYVNPLYKNNQFIGVVGMDIEFDFVVNIAKSIKTYKTGFAMVVNESGMIMYHPNYNYGEYLQGDELGLSDLAEKITTQDSNGLELLNYTLGDNLKYLSFSKLSNNMRLCIIVPENEINSKSESLIAQNVIITLGVALLFILIATIISKRIISPLKKLNDSAVRMLAGDLSGTLKRTTHDEIGTLIDSFNAAKHQLRKQIKSLNKTANQDGLTGVKNQNAYYAMVEKLNGHIIETPEETKFAIVVFDINNLKETNDNYGHLMGDTLLKVVADHIKNTFQQSFIFRIGGDEFVTILEGESYKNITALLEKFNNGLKTLSLASNSSVDISCAYGYAKYDPKEDSSFTDVFRKADEEMYKNKIAIKRSQ